MGAGWSRLSRACALLLAMTGLGGCVAQSGPYAYTPPLQLGQSQPNQAALPPPAGRRVAILLPLTGSGAELGQSMLKAAQHANDGPGAPALETEDTRGTPDGAAQAAQAALSAGAGIILGPLTAN